MTDRPHLRPENGLDSPAASDQIVRYLQMAYPSLIVYEHPPGNTVLESRQTRGDIRGTHTKNLFLRDKKRNLVLLTLCEDRAVSMKDVQRVSGASGNLSFGSVELLATKLGVRPGRVTPLVLPWIERGSVDFWLDEKLLLADRVNIPSTDGLKTLSFDAPAFARFVQSSVHVNIYRNL